MPDDATPTSLPENPLNPQATFTMGEVSALEAAGRQLPASIGRYRIIRLLGEGGMGAVYEAEQDQPRRRVALKVIKTAWASPEILRRFELESQTLGRLHHPGIAQIYEAGTADTGFGFQPFFAMELIHGKPLGEYADAQHLNTRQRLVLMIQVCEAVEHAHQRGIIHRDLKPGNILVDENGQPKILDFGLARVTDSDAQATRQTDMGQLLGTLAYMSPEQVLADPLALDTRSDVYALGVILYELLAGKMPYPLTRHLHEVVRTIQQTDPVPLSTVSRLYRGDIETIVARALEKDKTRRYASAAELAADIRRHLEDEPIAAKPPSTTYQLQKFARRHRALVAGTAAVFLVLVAGVIVSTWEAARAQRERNVALSEKRRADAEAASAKAVSDFLQNDLLAQASAANQSGPGNQPDPDLKVRTALDRAAARITGKFDKQPEVEAAIQDTIGQAYYDLGLYPEAKSHLERGLDLHRHVQGAENPKTLNTMSALGRIADAQGKYDEAEALLHQTLKTMRRVLGPEDPGTLRAMKNLAWTYGQNGKYQQAEALNSQALEIQRRVLGPENLDTLASMNNLANNYQSQGKYPQAEVLFSQTLEIKRRVLGPEHPNTLSSMMNLAIVYNGQGKYAQAEKLLIQTLGIQRRVLGPEHPSTQKCMINLAYNYYSQGKYAQAEALYSETAEIERRVLGPEHPDRLGTLANLAQAYESQGKYAQAEKLDRQILEIQRRVLGPEHPSTLSSMGSLAVLYGDQHKYAQAETLDSQILETRRRVLGLEHPDTLSTMNNLAEVYESEGKYAQAEPLYRQALEVGRRKLGADHPNTPIFMNNLAYIYVLEGRFLQAEPLLRQALEAERRMLGLQHPITLAILSSVVALYQRQGKFDLAETYAAQALAGRRHTSGTEDRDTMMAAADLALAYQSQGKFAKSEALAREIVDVDRKKRPDDWSRFRAETLLGASLAGQKKYAEAEPLLLSGYQGMATGKDRMAVADWYHLDRASEWIVRLYEDWGKPEKAAEWRRN